MEIEAARLRREWADRVEVAYSTVQDAVITEIAENGRDLDALREEFAGVPAFILRA
jgi:hypothetical protein